eukprot:CAMPEP_0119039996 /NCGR_PEP_ID=MMETSP1177-20130426/9787_1 /TAXON_ID=2985 /ORGANISM="Ochromonas sp, Strain CCMP1899" /LENGTH=192 /DNA_ID=CAMNT_0007004605 /DNA_START=93 /DNA_END=671 /DNA_ORIENTATION=-
MTVAMLAITVLDMFSITESFKSGSTNMNSILLRRRTRSVMSMNFFDNIKIIFSKEGQDNIKAFDDKEKEEALIAQKEILARRSDPKKMREYEQKNEANRIKLAEERAVYKFQQKQAEGYDPLTDWQKLKDEGKIKMSKDLERDSKSSRLGSEGLIEVRVDERMPYIDQGYVDEESDVMGKFMGLFKKKDEKK